MKIRYLAVAGTLAMSAALSFPAGAQAEASGPLARPCGTSTESSGGYTHYYYRNCMTPPGGAVYKKAKVTAWPDGDCVGPIYPGETKHLHLVPQGFHVEVVNC